MHKVKWFGLSPKDRATTDLAVSLALRGERLSGYQFHSERKPYCDQPVLVRRVRESSVSDAKPLEVSFYAPCRRCAKCLQFRQMRWRERALAEIALAPRTWLVTLTFAPVHLAGILAEAALRKERDVDARIDAAASKHLQRFLKRLRKNTKRKVRYLAVFERGEKTGRPHYHLLIHEVDGPVLKSAIEWNWQSNVHARLVDKGSGAASYVTKYATKSLSTRLRASIRYGGSPKPG